jgi:hypothetical protein
VTVEFSERGVYDLWCQVSDSAESDTVKWQVTVGDVSISSSLIPHPSSLALFPPSPNPFNAQTTIRFDLPVTAEASLRVYDLSGRLVEELLNGTLEAGGHSMIWDGSAAPSGMYILRLQASENVKLQRAVLIR